MQEPAHFHSFCDAVLREFPATAPGWYLEWEQTDPAQFDPPFSFPDEYCGSEPEDALCRADEAHNQAEAIRNPSDLWVRNHTRGHQFFKSADVSVPLEVWKGLLEQATGLLNVPRGPATPR